MEMDYRSSIERVAKLIKESPLFYALTGAGISTESGIPDFRSPGTGIWEKVDPFATSTVHVLQENPALFYEAGFSRFAEMIQAEPNRAHHALKQMEDHGYLKGIITQNIDSLHWKAGSRRVWEVHGHLRTCHCQGCCQRFSFEVLVEKVAGGQIPPPCPRCSGILRPDVVLFGDTMSPAFFEAEEVLRKGCDLMMVIGSSLVVYPVADLVRFARKLVIINAQETNYDYRAEVVIREKCGQVLTDIVKALEE